MRLPFESRELFSVVKRIGEAEYPRKACVCREGQEADSVVLLVQGQVTLFRRGRAGNVPICMLQVPGEVLSNPLGSPLHEFTMVAASRLKVLLIRRELLSRLPRSWLNAFRAPCKGALEAREDRFMRSEEIHSDQNQSTPPQGLSLPDLIQQRKHALKSTYSTF
jgi:hypothetical protein